MSNALSLRLKKLERQRAADPHAHLTDAELMALIAEIDHRIEAATGMSSKEYADMLSGRIRRKEPLPHGLLECVAWDFIKARSQGTTHVQ